ncbi:MAG: homocysteine S-methyltransferase family protein [Phycisphaerales bacterium]|nr:homocysteine S-methyltransferase family protein [Phycisphaerae bacterium]NNF41681.1 homocysteine S-methyltransferase family protein [Phycisphaerales bacterium]NNM27551.1 homocysteine S-methyltransferase family protein [Phycisphaerales bacterium]
MRYHAGTPVADADSILILDGATGTELARRGVDISLPLWSARALLDAPEVVEAIHRDYLEAGAGAIITNTFRTHRRSLAKAGLGDQARALTHRAVEIARATRDRVKPAAKVLGSVAPLEDCYRPDLAPSPQACMAEHAEIIQDLLDAGVDDIVIETMSARHEAAAAAAVADNLCPGRWMMSFCLKTDGPPGVLLQGATLVDMLPLLSGAHAVGVNCIDASKLTPQVELLRKLLPHRIRVAAYGNIGHADPDGSWTSSDALDPERYAAYARDWVRAGATIIGGCCGTTPETIRAMAGLTVEE